MSVTHSPSSRTTPPSSRPHAARPSWVGPAILVGIVLTVAAMATAVTASIEPLRDPNQLQELGFPLASAPIGFFMVTVAIVLAARNATRWAALLACTGILWVANALLVAVRTLGVNGHVPHTVYVGSIWVEQWFYVVPDLAAFVPLPMTLPGGRISGRWRIPVAAVLVAGVVQIVAGGVGTGPMDDTSLPNPLVAGHNGLISLRDDLYVPTLLVGLLVVVARGIAARRSEPIPVCAALVSGVVAILLSTLAEGMLERPTGPSWVPWLPVAIAVPFAVVLWSRVAGRGAPR